MSTATIDHRHKLTALVGIFAVSLFGVALAVFSSLNPNFHPAQDYVSKLGAIGQPYALWWNLTGFIAVGLLLAGFGFAYGHYLQDRFVGLLLAMFGIGFAATAIPVDPTDGNAALSKLHVLAICLGLGGWMIGLARMASLSFPRKSTRVMANIAAVLVMLPMFGQVAALWPMPVTHRLVFIVVFGWVAITSIRLLCGLDKIKTPDSVSRHSNTSQEDTH